MYPLLLLSLAVLRVAGVLAQGSSTLPTVDLGYTIHQATIGVRALSCDSQSSLHFRTLTLHDQSTENGVSYLSFSNIRYAAPPTGALRFAAPVRPSVNRTVQDGQMTSICSQCRAGLPQRRSSSLAGDYRLSELYREGYTARRPAHIRRLSVP